MLPLRRASLVVALAVALPLLPVPTGAQAADPAAQARREVAAVRAEVEVPWTRARSARATTASR